MANYAVIEEEICTNVVVCDDPAYAADHGWVALEGIEPLPWIGWRYDGSQWSAPPEPKDE